MQIMIRISLISFLALSLQGCVGLLIDTAVDTTIAVAKVPFKVGGAVVDVVTGDDDDDKD
jgi:hypothetical protein